MGIAELVLILSIFTKLTGLGLLNVAYSTMFLYYAGFYLVFLILAILLLILLYIFKKYLI